MSNTMIYILRVTDLTSGCQSPPSQVIVTIAGGPLSVNPVAQPDAVCLGDTAFLFALSGGGSGIYTYSWSSVPPGFTSSSANPFVIPTGTTSYQIILNDGFNQRTGTAAVTVYPLPVVHLGPADTSVCIYDTVRLDAGNPGSTYLWSNGSTGRYLTASTTGIGYDLQTYSVVVTDQHGCSNMSTINLVFAFDGCVGISEHPGNADFSIYPNPAQRTFHLQIRNTSRSVTADLMNLLGTRVLSRSMARSNTTTIDQDFDISGFSPGVYILYVYSDKFAGSAKLVIQ
jgi:hypothetical protein